VTKGVAKMAVYEVALGSKEEEPMLMKIDM